MSGSAAEAWGQKTTSKKRRETQRPREKEKKRGKMIDRIGNYYSCLSSSLLSSCSSSFPLHFTYPSPRPLLLLLLQPPVGTTTIMQSERRNKKTLILTMRYLQPCCSLSSSPLPACFLCLPSSFPPSAACFFPFSLQYSKTKIRNSTHLPYYLSSF